VPVSGAELLPMLLAAAARIAIDLVTLQRSALTLAYLASERTEV
jgi:hypothetical protein